MDNEYQPHQIEQLAQEDWEDQQCFKVKEDLSKEKFYCLSMLPYPSGKLHMGHVRNYTLGDIIARYQRMQGKNVLQPMGWDAFGLPAENAAFAHKVAPAVWTRNNIAAMREQLKRLGFAYDWKRELTTCDPSYYRWEQWLFTRLFQKGLVYKKMSNVNWDPVDQTVLANEQVIDGKGWRSGAPVERRAIAQWFLKITDYADELLECLDDLTEWPEQVRMMQTNWIGRSEGLEVYFKVPDQTERLKIFTTRPDTVYGCTYLAIAPQHRLAEKASATNPELAKFIEEHTHIKVSEAEMATLEKRGVNTGLVAIHPFTGETLPIWVANFVMVEYGSGAVMCVPAHDQRDWEFAQKYQLPLRQVIAPGKGEVCDLTQSAFTPKGRLINSDRFNEMDSATAFKAIAEWVGDNDHGKIKIHYRLRDWGVSRQRYWGTPIPIINCPSCGAVPVPEDQLPVILPEEVDFSSGLSPLKTDPHFYQTTCPVCGFDAERETDTLDTFFESSWYYLRYASYNQENAMLDDRANYWCPVDYYIGGIEHAVLHLLYARFFHKLLRDEGLVNSNEPFKKLLTQGMVLKDGVKMSKSKGNVVDPDALIEQYGSDTIRLFITFAAPPDQALEWSDAGVEGAHRFLKRLWHVGSTIASEDFTKSIDWADCSHEHRQWRQEFYTILKQVVSDYERSQFNTVVSGCMKILNLLGKRPETSDVKLDATVAREAMNALLRLLAPITPHICHVLWRELDFGKWILDAPWPKVVKEALKLETVDYVVQINGKLRAQLTIASEASPAEVEAAVLQEETVKKYLVGKTVLKTIVVAKKHLINLVVSE